MTSTNKRIGFYGGTFDPIHNGHISLALELSEKHELDEVLFCPASISPHKKQTPPRASKEHRRAMITAAIAPFPQFTFLDYELQQNTESYTSQTLQYLSQKYPQKTFFLLLGEDNARSIPTWPDGKLLLELAIPLVGSWCSEDLSEMDPYFAAIFKKGWTPIHMKTCSTWIRERIKQGKYVEHLLTGRVWDYIQIHQLYR
jgi:nicotinate-nucleotide adenylyltransferase